MVQNEFSKVFPCSLSLKSAINFLNHKPLMLAHGAHPNPANQELPHSIQPRKLPDRAEDGDCSDGGNNQSHPGMVGGTSEAAEGFAEGEITD